MKKFVFFNVLFFYLFTCPPLWAQINNCLYFDGNGDYTEANSPLSGNNDFTVEMWFRSESNYPNSCNSNFSNFNWLISWDNDGFGIGDCAGDLRVAYKPLCPIQQGMCTSLPTATINDGNWHHVAFAKSSLSIHIYLDGAYLTNFSGGTYNLDGFFRLGRSGTGTLGNDWQGPIDEVRIWNYKRSPSEILQTLNCELGGDEAGLVLYYDFNQGIPFGNNASETTLLDRTANGNHATLHNFGLNGDISNYVPSAANVNNPCGLPCEAVFEYIISDCGEVTFINQSMAAAPTYSWDFGDGQSSTDENPVYVYTADGTYTVCLTVTDGPCTDQICNTIFVTIDNQPPVINCVQPIPPYPTSPGECTAKVDLNVTVSDNCKVGLSCTRSDGLDCNDPFPKGTTTVIYTATDEGGNISTCSIVIQVEDFDAPILNCTNISATAPSGEDGVAVDYPLPDLIDNCPMASVVCTPPSGSFFPCGQTVVLCLATDMSGNQSECAFIVNVECMSNPTNYCDSAEIICRDEIDVLFIMDNSGSISMPKFNAMVSITQNAISDIDGAYPNAQYAVVHYGGNYGDKVYIEHDFTNKATASVITRQGAGGLPGGGPLGGYGDDFHGSLDAIIDALTGVGSSNTKILSPSKNLNKRAGSSFYLLYFTDAGPGISPTSAFGSAMKGTVALPYRNVNILKSSPFNGKFTVVHFDPPTNINIDQTSGAIASPGGTYVGSIDIDTDPMNPDPNTIPRQYIKTNFSATSIDILSSLPPCDTILSDFPCDSLMVMATEVNSDSCCYSIDLKNNIGPDISCVEAEIISGGWVFNTGSILGTGFTWACPPTNNKLCLSYPGGIPTGTTADVLRYCFASNIEPPAALPQVVVFNWFCGEGADKRLVCSDTIITECDGKGKDPCLVVNDLDWECNPDNPYEYILNFTVTNNTAFDATLFTLGILPPYSFSFCSSSSPTNYISLPLSPNPLPSTQTSNNMCVKIISSAPILSPTQVCFDVGLNSPFECCHKAEQICVVLDKCCDPCEDRDYLVQDLMADSAECCYQIDIIENCGYHLFSKVETKIITSGVIFGYHALGGPEATNWNVPSSSPTSIFWTSNLGYIPPGTTSDIIQFCLDGIDDPSEVPQQVLLKWYMLDVSKKDSLACTDTLTFDCPAVDNKCLAISDRSLVCIPDSNKYRYTFTVTNTSSIPFTADFMDVFILSPTDLYFDPSGGVFPLTPALSSSGQQTVSSCIKSSSSTFPSTASDIILSYRLRFNRGDTCCYESVLDTLPLPPCDSSVCVACPSGFTTGLNLISNGDFENGNDGSFSSDHSYLAPSAVLGSGQYSVRNSTNLGNSQWAALDHTAGTTTGQFLVADGSTTITNAAWRSSISVNPGSDYNFCMYANNLVLPNRSFSDPLIEVRINGTVIIPSTLVLENPDIWVLMSGSWTAPSGITSATIEIFSLDGVSTGNDYAIDDISFSECISDVPPCCHDFELFCELAEASFVYDFVCDTLCFFPVIDTCLEYCWNWGDGSPTECITANPVCHVYNTDVPRTYYVCMDVFENTTDTTCWFKQICDSIFIDPCIPPITCEKNLVLNDGFEIGLTPGQMPVPGQVNNWYSGGGYYPRVIGDDGCKADGSLELEGDQNNGDVIVQDINLFPGNTYAISVCAKSMIDPGFGGQFAIEAYSTGPYDYPTCSGPCEAIGISPTLSNSWTTYTFNYSPAIAQNYFTIQSWNQFNDGETLIRIDDICIEEIDPIEPGCACEDLMGDIGSGPKTAQNCESVKLKFSGLGECDELRIDWGDGSPFTSVPGTATAYHTYSSFGTYNVLIFIIRTLPDGTQCEEAVNLTFKVECLPRWPGGVTGCEVKNSDFSNGAIPGNLSGPGHSDNWKTASGGPVVVKHRKIVTDTVPVIIAIMLESKPGESVGIEQAVSIVVDTIPTTLSIIVDRLRSQEGIAEPWGGHNLTVYASIEPLGQKTCEDDNCETVAIFEIPEMKDGEDALTLVAMDNWEPKRDYNYLTLRVDNNGNETSRSLISAVCLGLDYTIATEDLFTAREIKIYPNPTEDLINIHFTESVDEELSLRVFDLFGRVIYQTTVKGDAQDYQLNLSDWAAGVYLLQLRDASGRAFRQKMVKQ